jgi:SAM-dependent methyltransferase
MRRESDEEVRQNIDAELVPLFNRVRRNISGNDHETRTEAFLRYVEEHPHEEIEAADRIAGFALKSALRPTLDFYETPSWAIRALRPVLPIVEGVTRILDPGCGTGAIIRELGAMYPENEIIGLEIEEWRFKAAAESTDLPVSQGDFFKLQEKFDVIVANPPYSQAIEFVQHAITLAPVVCMLLRLPWLASIRRAQWHRDNPAHVCVLPKRPSFTPDGKTDATDYAWFIWGDDCAGGWEVLDVDLSDTKKARR